MARVVERIPPRGAHPWNRWLDWQLWELVQGEDFHCDPHNFRGTVRSYIKGRGLAIETFKVRRNKVYLRVKRNG